jgi:hypothetical protein
MSKALILKIAFLLAMLLMVISTIQRLNSQTVETAFEHLGIDAGAYTSNKSKSNLTANPQSTAPSAINAAKTVVNERTSLAAGQPPLNSTPNLQGATSTGQPGLNSPATAPPADASRNICPTRIDSITFADGLSIFEETKGLKMRWMSKKLAAVHEIDYLEMEKWLGIHCQVKVSMNAMLRPGDFKDFAVIKYIDGKELRIGQFPIEPEIFMLGVPNVSRSPELFAAFRDLVSLATANKH